MKWKSDYRGTNFNEVSKFYTKRKGKYSSEKVIPKRMRDLTYLVEEIKKTETDYKTKTIILTVFDDSFWKNNITLVTQIASLITRRDIKIEIYKKTEEKETKEVHVKKQKKRDIVLFSGGLDSFATAIENSEAVLIRVNMAKTVGKQAKKARKMLSNKKYFEVPFTMPKSSYPSDPSNARGLIFICLASLFIPAFQSDRIIVGENGVLIYNPPFFEGAELTQGLSPEIIKPIEILISKVYEKEIKIEFPNINKTKKQVLEKVLQKKGPQFFNKMLNTTHSCFIQQSTKGIKNKVPMCGVCYACIVRRLSVLALNQDEADNYRYNTLNETGRLYSRGGKGIFFVMDLLRLMKIYEKGLLSPKQERIIKKDEQLFQTYFSEVKTAIQNAKNKNITIHNNIR